ncbi:DUF2059 domain-containing protein [Mucilaginibacter sp. Mucisp86]|uniref:DUF2059 domain-containing protein n=1 Tax=Mucilaginibacter sp. Mucisp86 TaxID=3243060 RepID=UPI0039B6B25C
MNLKLKLIVLAGVILFSFSSVEAQTTNQTITPAHLGKAVQMLQSIGIDKQFDNMVNNLITASSSQMPENNRSGYIKVMKTFMGKYFTWDLLKDKMAAIYANEFSEEELGQITAFYNSPIGQKVSSKLPSLMQKGMMVGQEVVGQHKDELQQMMEAEFADKNDPPAVKEQVSPAANKPASKAPVKH